MRTTEDRLLAVKLRAKEIENQKRMGKRHALVISSFAASLVFIVGLSFLMPGILSPIPDDKYGNFATSASIFYGGNFYGFVLIGALAFALGVSVTILAYKIKKLNQQDQEGNK